MADSRLKAQIEQDSVAVSKISDRARESFGRELRGTLDRGAFYSFASATKTTR